MPQKSSIQTLPPYCDQEPLSGANAGGFTYTSIVKRLPDIIDSVVHHNRKNSRLTADQIQRLNALKSDIALSDGGNPTNSALHLKEMNDNDDEERKDWIQYQKMYKVTEKSWLQLPWFFVENWMYKLVLDICVVKKGHDDDDDDGETVITDPFEQQKIESLDQAFESGSVSVIARTVQHYLDKLSASSSSDDDQHEDRREFLAYLIGADLWGNKADLSFSGGVVENNDEETHDHSTISKELRSQYIVDDDSELAINTIEKDEPQSYNFIVDNCGLELVCDLFFGYCLNQVFHAKHVTFYVKTQPVFVSDAMIKDVYYTIERMEQSKDAFIEKFGRLFRESIESGRWIIQSHKFFTSPTPFYQMDNDLYDKIAQSGQLTILKGDANYRRLFNDRNYDISERFEELVDNFPTDLLSLRTLKSDCLVGLSSEEQKQKAKSLYESDPEWRVNGKYGVISWSKFRS